MFEKEENPKRCRSLTWWALLLVTILGLCVLGVSFRAATQSSAHCPVYVEKLDNIHSLADQATNELGRAFAEKLAEMYGLADQSCQAHIKGNAYFEEGSPRADFEYQRALDLDEQILGKIGAVVPAFGVTAELKATLEEAQRLYSQQVNIYAQSRQQMTQAGMAYRIGNRTVGDRLLDRANSANDSATQLEDRAFTLLEEAAELLCQLTEQEEEESVPQPGEATTAIALTPPEGEYVGEVPIEECPECPREEGGPAKITDQGIQVPTPIFGVSEVLFDQVTDCETGEGIDPSLLQTEFVFRSGAQAPYDLGDLQSVILRAEGYEDTQILDFTPMQLSLGFIQFTVLAPREREICLYRKSYTCKCKRRLSTGSKLHAKLYFANPWGKDIPLKDENGKIYYCSLGELGGAIQLSKTGTEKILWPSSMFGKFVLLHFTDVDAECGKCNKHGECSPDKQNIKYKARITDSEGKKPTIVTNEDKHMVLVAFDEEVEIEVTATWDCVCEGCTPVECSQKYKLRLTQPPKKCSCWGIDAAIKVYKVDSTTKKEVPGSGSSATVEAHLGAFGKEINIVSVPWNDKWKPGDTLVVRIEKVRATCLCAGGSCPTYFSKDPAKISLGKDKDDRSNLTLVKGTDEWKSAKDEKTKKTVHWYEFTVTLGDRSATEGAKQCFTVEYRCKKPADTDCKSRIREDPCKQEFCIVLKK